MAGDDWIRMRTDLYRDPKVCIIADVLAYADGALSRYVNQNCQCDMAVTRNVMRNATVGALVTVWGIMRHRGKRDGDDLRVRGVTRAVIDDIADLPGFGDAMASVGWVVDGEECLVFPRFFEEWNSDPLEAARKKNADRQRRFRDSHRDVTVTLHRNGKVTPEKRRVEKNKEPASAGCPEPLPAASGPPALVFPTVGKEPEWPLPAVQVAEWKKAFPHLDVPGECRKALAWVNANPAKRKTARGMAAFLYRWLSRAQDRGGSPPLNGATLPPGLSPAQREASRREAEARKATDAGADPAAVKEGIGRLRGQEGG